jgi:hypothetical protein
MKASKILLLIASIGAGGCRVYAEAPKAATLAADETPALALSHSGETSGRSAATAAFAEERVREITIPAGTQLRLRLGSTVSSRSSRVEDPVQATLRAPIVINGVTVVPAGAVVSGYVTETRRSGRVKGRARIGVRFTTVRVAGSRYPVRTASIAREAPGTKKADATKIGIGAGAGAITGALAGGKKGAAIGTAVGGGAGTGLVLATRGREVSLPRGTAVTTRLTSPLTIRVRD